MAIFVENPEMTQKKIALATIKSLVGVKADLKQRFSYDTQNCFRNAVLARMKSKSADLSELGLKVAIFALLSELTQYNTLGYYESLNYVKVQI